MILDIASNDTKSAAAIQRKIIMGGCNHQWMHGVRQIISILETKQNDKEDEHGLGNIEWGWFSENVEWIKRKCYQAQKLCFFGNIGVYHLKSSHLFLFLNWRYSSH